MTTPPETYSNAPTLVRLPTVKAMTAKGRTAIYADMKKGSFPQSVRLSRRSVAWVESEIIQWVAARISERDRGAGQ